MSPAFWERCRHRVREVYGARAAEQLALVEGRYAAGIRPVTASDVTVGVPSQRLGVDSGISGLLSGIEWSRQFGPDGEGDNVYGPEKRDKERGGSGTGE